MPSALEGAVVVCWRRGCLCAGGMFLPVKETLKTYACWGRHRVFFKGVIRYVGGVSEMHVLEEVSTDRRRRLWRMRSWRHI